MENWKQERPLRIKVYSVDQPDANTQVEMGVFRLAGDFRNEHLEWAILAEDGAMPYHVIERREWTHNWGAFSEGVDVILQLSQNPYVQMVIGALMGKGAEAAAKWIIESTRSEPVTEDETLHQARQYLVLTADYDAAELKPVAAGTYPNGARWVELHSADRGVTTRVGVARTRNGGHSIGVESWRSTDHPE